MSRGVIFDLDGTLADTLPDIAAAVNSGLRTFGVPERPPAEIAQWVGAGLPTLCERALAATGAAVAVDHLVETVRGSYREHVLDRTQPFAGIPELLAELSRRAVPMAVLTNKPHELTVPIVTGLFSRWQFVAVEGYRQEDRKKPDPRTALEIVAQMGLLPADVLMVGDSATDILTGVNAGMVPVGVTWGYRDRNELASAGAKHIINQPAELLGLL